MNMRLLNNGHMAEVGLSESFWGVAVDPGSLSKDESHAALANMAVAGLLSSEQGRKSAGRQSQGQREPRSSDPWEVL